MLTFGYIYPNDLGRCYSKKIAGLTRNSSFNHDRSQFTVNFDDLQFSDLGFGSSHSTGHLLSLVYPAGSSTGTNWTQGSVTFGAMGHWPTTEVVPFDSAWKRENAECSCSTQRSLQLIVCFLQTWPMFKLDEDFTQHLVAAWRWTKRTLLVDQVTSSSKKKTYRLKAIYARIIHWKN